MDRLLNLDRRIIFLLLLIAVTAATLLPVGQSFKPSKLVKAVYDKIEQMPERSVVMLVTDFDPQAKAELYPMTMALLKHCFRNNHRVIGLTFWQEGAPMGKSLFDQAAQQHATYLTPEDIRAPEALAQRILKSNDPVAQRLRDLMPKAALKGLAAAKSDASKAKRIASALNSSILTAKLYDEKRFEQVALDKATQDQIKRDAKDVALARLNRALLAAAYPQELAPMRADAAKKSGEDYVYLGYKPAGMAALITNLGENITGAFDKDITGQATDGMPVLEGVPTLTQVDLIVDVAAGATVEPWIIYGGDKYRVATAGGCTAVQAPDLYPFVHSKQLVGLIGGLRGVADYESLMAEPDKAVRAMWPQSMAHSVIIAFVILGNALFFLSGRRTRGERGR